jgi:hypothetical protein
MCCRQACVLLQVAVTQQVVIMFAVEFVFALDCATTCAQALAGSSHALVSE